MSGRPAWNLSPHGTPAAYRRHLRREEDPCTACSDAEARRQYARPGKEAWNARRRERYATARAAGLSRNEAHDARSRRAA